VTIRYLTHNRVRLALHDLGGGDGPPLLLLHGLGDRSPDVRPHWLATWPGPVSALDFTGHGLSTVPAGGGYSAEMMLADADAALEAVGTATLCGRGLGAYVALMLAGARAARVEGAILADGPGLLGGATTITSSSYMSLPPSAGTPDPYALSELSRDLRPPDYATQFVRMAFEGSPVHDPVVVTAVVRPPWLAAVVDEPGVVTCAMPPALALYAHRP
jgi:pimeloyl-ACP methyl ester carboxylesterase